MSTALECGLNFVSYTSDLFWTYSKNIYSAKYRNRLTQCGVLGKLCFLICRHRVLQHSTVLHANPCLSLQASVQRSEEPISRTHTQNPTGDSQTINSLNTLHASGMTVSLQLNNIASQMPIEVSILQVSCVSKIWELQHLFSEQSDGELKMIIEDDVIRGNENRGGREAEGFMMFGCIHVNEIAKKVICLILC